MPDQLRVHVEPLELTVEPGGDAVTISVRVFNATKIVDEFTVAVIGVGQWLDADSSTLRLFPDKDGSAELSVSIPKGRFVPAGIRTVGVQIASGSNPSLSRTERVSITVAEVAAEQTISLEPQVVRGEESAQLVATVRNRANTPLALTLRGEDPERVVRFTFNPPTLQIPAGGEAWTMVSITAPRPDTENPGGRQLTILAEGGRAPLAATGTFIQEPKAPVVTRGRLLLLGIVLTLAGGAMLIGGAFLPWVGGAKGFEVTYDAYGTAVFGLEPGTLPASPTPFPEDVDDFLTSAGMVTIVLGALAVIGVLTQKGGLTKFAGGVSLIFLIAFMIGLAVRVEGASFELGMWVVLLGAALALTGAILRGRPAT